VKRIPDISAYIFGGRGQGKTTLSLALALIHHENVIVWDPSAQFDGYVISYPHELRVWIEADERPRVCVYRPVIDIRGSRSEAHEQFAEMMSVLVNGPNGRPYSDYSVIVDEADNLQGPTARELCAGLNWLMRRSGKWPRHPYGVTVIQNSHALVDFSATVKRLATDIFIVAAENRRDFQQLKEQFGSENLAAHVFNLRQHEVIHLYKSTDDAGRHRWCYSVWPREQSESWHVEPAGARASRLQERSRMDSDDGANQSA